MTSATPHAPRSRRLLTPNPGVPGLGLGPRPEGRFHQLPPYPASGPPRAQISSRPILVWARPLDWGEGGGSKERGLA
eukprot:scaffold6199_cov296-Prasinococcus_capsulatus_cf.AAC.1